MSDTDRRLIEDLIPIREISAEASREKSLRHGNISTLHLWWARRPIVAARAAVYASLVPAPKDDEERLMYKETMKKLCKWDLAPDVLKHARADILAANGGQPPKVLDMFAGGGSIPLEALRLGCESYAVELNPVAHIIELCTLVYPQKYGRSLVDDVRKWGTWVIEHAKEELAEFYPSPEQEVKVGSDLVQGTLSAERIPTKVNGELTPIAYLWTRTVSCSNPECGAIVPLVRQTWLRNKPGKYVALHVVPDHSAKRARFEVVEAAKAEELGFDPEDGSKRGNTLCFHCGTTANIDYIKFEGREGRIGYQPMAIVATKEGYIGKVYLNVDTMDSPSNSIRLEANIQKSIKDLCNREHLTLPEEPLPVRGTLGFRVQAYGILKWKDLFTSRQLLVLLTLTSLVHQAYNEMLENKIDSERALAITTYLGLIINRLADFNSTLCRWISIGDKVANTYARQALPMVWDFAEINPFGNGSGNSIDGLKRILEAIENCVVSNRFAELTRVSATRLPFDDAFMDAVVTDPPYYDNVPYADLSDFFYVWFKRTIGFLYPEHLRSELTPKKQEAIAEPSRYEGNMVEARRAYENMMAQSFIEAHRVLKPSAPLICVYAHKTTLGWSTLINALRRAGFVIVEAWPLDTERPGRVRDINSAALASSIFLVARRRENQSTGDYESEVKPELVSIVNERLDTLIKEDVTGADLMIAALGAGLRAYTQFARVELPNGDELPTDQYLEDVQREVAQQMLQRLLKSGSDLSDETASRQVAAVDAMTRLYMVERYFYGEISVPFDDMNLLARSMGLELMGPRGLNQGKKGLAKMEKDKASLRNYRDRGDDPHLGLLTEGGNIAPLIDILHRLLWLQDEQPHNVAEFLKMSQADRQIELLQHVAEILAGPALTSNGNNGTGKHERTEEQQALGRLLSGWRIVFSEQNVRQMLRERTLWNFEEV
ncbi:MAG: DUF1156 domain-containing protein [Ktedonobacteraceae bacterium]|nr:DUF1156 domain-containing protein [Ktedonobacteraceae bacterium]